jgi:hypothetical protein
MPSAAIFSPDGQALLSWRVALLPFLGEGSLYEQFKFDEPWDSDHNRKLLAKMPAVYLPRRGPAPKEPYATYYQVFTGNEAPFNLQAGMIVMKGVASKGKLGPKITDFTDGVAQTFLVVEAGEAVPWTKPADLVYEAEKPLPELGFGDRFYLVLADGSSHFLKKSIGDDIIRGGITHRAYANSLGSDPITREGQEIEPVLYSDKRFVLDQE